jgi:short-subunit dehydrogenase
LAQFFLWTVMSMKKESSSKGLGALPQEVLIVGATSAIAEHCMRLWADAGVQSVCLVGRDAGKLERVHSDLMARFPSLRVRVRCCQDFMDVGQIGAILDELFGDGRPELALIAHGDLPDQTRCQMDLTVAKAALEVNGVSPVLWAEAIVQRSLGQGATTIGVIGSVAGDRGRQSNYVYGAAKGLVERYVEGMQHRLAGSQIHLSLIKPGPTATPMTKHLTAKGQKMAAPELVAAQIVRGMRERRFVIYTPPKWRIIMTIIKWLPRQIFHRLGI